MMKFRGGKSFIFLIFQNKKQKNQIVIKYNPKEF